MASSIHSITANFTKWTVTVQATVRTLRGLSKLIVNDSIIPAQKRPDGELLQWTDHRTLITEN